MNNIRLAMVGAALVAGILGGIIFVAMKPAHSQAADASFRAYLKRQASSNHLEQTSESDDPDSSYKSKVVLDIPSQSMVVEGDLSCAVDSGTQKASVGLSIQATNAQLLFNIHHINGKIAFKQAGIIDLTDLYSKELNTWYYASNFQGLPEFTSSQKLFMVKYLTDGQTKDMQKLTDDLLANQAITYKFTGQRDDRLTYKMTTHRQAFKGVLANTFDGFDAQGMKDGVDTLFDNADTVSETITISSDGRLLEENSVEHNLCQELSGRFIGTNPEAVKKDVGTRTITRPNGSVRITPVTDYRTESDMQARQKIYFLHTGHQL